MLMALLVLGSQRGKIRPRQTPWAGARELRGNAELGPRIAPMTLNDRTAPVLSAANLVRDRSFFFSVSFRETKQPVWVAQYDALTSTLD